MFTALAFHANHPSPQLPRRENEQQGRLADWRAVLADDVRIDRWNCLWRAPLKAEPRCEGGAFSFVLPDPRASRGIGQQGAI